MVQAGPKQVPFFGQAENQPTPAQQVEGRKEWVFPSFFVARREVRKFFPSVTTSIYSLQPPKVIFYDRIIEGRFLGLYDFDTNTISIAITGDDSEDYSSLCHEMIHFVAQKTQGLSPAQRQFLHGWVEEEFKSGRY